MNLSWRLAARTASRTIVIFIAITLVYYFAVWRPEQTAPTALKAARSIVNQQRTDLINDRLGISQLVSLQPGSATFALDRVNLVSRLGKANQAGRATEAQPLKLRQTSQTSPIIKRLPALMQSGHDILVAQQSLIDATTSFEIKFKDLLGYYPSDDLGSVSGAQRAARATAARNGLAADAARLDPSMTDAASQIRVVSSQLSQLATQASAGDSAGSQQTLTQLSAAYESLRASVWTDESNIWQTSEAKAILARQDQLIRDYAILLNGN